MKRYMIVGLLVIFLATATLAHDPDIEDEDWGAFDNPVEMPVPSISYAMYGYLDEGDVDVFKLEFAEQDFLRVELLVPVCGEHYTEFVPQYAIIGAGESSDIELPVALDVPEGMTVLHYGDNAPNGERDTFVEPFGNTEFYESPRTDYDITEPGTYYVAVFHPEAMSGDYTLVTGYREEFESPMLETLADTAMIRQNGWLHRDCSLSTDDPNAFTSGTHHEGGDHFSVSGDHDHDDHEHDDDAHHDGSDHHDGDDHDHGD